MKKVKGKEELLVMYHGGGEEKEDKIRLNKKKDWLSY